jgi:hypothetical protein
MVVQKMVKPYFEQPPSRAAEKGQCIKKTLYAKK